MKKAAIVVLAVTLMASTAHAKKLEDVTREDVISTGHKVVETVYHSPEFLFLKAPKAIITTTVKTFCAVFSFPFKQLEKVRK